MNSDETDAAKTVCSVDFHQSSFWVKRGDILVYCTNGYGGEPQLLDIKCVSHHCSVVTIILKIGEVEIIK